MAAVAMIASRTAAQNLLTDSGFEDPTKFTSDGPPFVGFWEAFNGGAGSFSVRDDVMPHSGGFSAHIGIDNTDNTFAGVFQDVPVAPGSKFVFSGWNKIDVAGPGLEFRIEWRDAANEVGRTGNFDPGATTSYTQFSTGVQTAPANATTARVVYAIQTFGGSTNPGQVFLDDFSAGAVPEPSAAALLALGGMALVRNRRRL
jgi:hypothetical protein